MHSDADIVPPEGAQRAMRDTFLAWQCRIRQLAVRQAGGRPTAGMRPRVLLQDGRRDLGPITVLILKREPAAITAQWRHMVRRTQDPAERYGSALAFLAAAHYQRPQEFSDVMPALFGPDAGVADDLLAAAQCVLDFAQYQQRFRVPCDVRVLAESEPAFAATFWHNALFNPNLPAGVRVLAFTPDWTTATADPPVG